MRREIQRRIGWQAVCLILLFGFLLSLRVIGPLGAVSAKDGYVAICAGGTMVYIPVDEIGLALSAEEDSETIEDRCPWFGFGSVLAIVDPPKGSLVIAASLPSLALRAAQADPALPAFRANRPRAPPLG